MFKVQEPLRPKPESRLTLLGNAAERYSDDLFDVLEWLEARGIGLGTGATFRLGVVNDPLPDHERYRGRLCIPYLDAKGNVAQLRFRCLRDHNCKDHNCPKYMTMAGDDVRLFNTQALLTSEPVLHITEGEFDAMILHQLGLKAVAAPGVNTWARHHTVMCSGFEAAYIWGDGDDAGRDFNNAMQQRLEIARPVSMPQGLDVTDLYLQGGADAVLGLLRDTERMYRHGE